ncbi:hypothetical protein ACRAWF_11525 [Streptomyces sp. L7]
MRLDVPVLAINTAPSAGRASARPWRTASPTYGPERPLDHDRGRRPLPEHGEASRSSTRSSGEFLRSL